MKVHTHTHYGPMHIGLHFN